MALSWSRREGVYHAYIDGNPTATGPFEQIRDAAGGALSVGGSGEFSRGKVAYARLDEFALWDRPLKQKAVAWLYQQGCAGKPLWKAQSAPQPTGSPDRLRIIEPRATRDALPELVPQRITPTRTQIDLGGSWLFLASNRRLSELPQDGWVTAAVPGYWAGKAVPEARGRGSKGQPAGRSAECAVGYYLVSFHAAPDWKRQAVLLHLDGVDGLAELYLNGKRLGQLIAWENEDYELGPHLEFGGENTLVIALHRRGKEPVAGIYGKVSLDLAPLDGSRHRGSSLGPARFHRVLLRFAA